MTERFNQPSLDGGRVTVEVPSDATAQNANSAYDDDVQVFDGASRLLFLNVQVSENAPAVQFYVLVFDARSDETIRTGRASLFDAPKVTPGDSFTFSEPVVERDPDGFPFDRGIRVIACSSKTYDPANVVADAIKTTSRVQTKPKGSC